MYNDPKPSDTEKGRTKPLLLEIAEVSRYQCFGDNDLLNQKALEPFTAISVMPSEIYVIERTKFIEYLSKVSNNVYP
jgi:hypothetical protein